MTSLRRYIPIAAIGMLLSLGLLVSGCDSSAPADDGELVESQDLNVAERIDVQDNLGSVKSALQDAGLLDSLRNENTQFTVFAPPLSDVNTGKLKDLNVFNDVIGYHVVEGQTISSGDLSGTATTMSGEELNLGALSVVESDLPASNGVVHRIASTRLETQSVRTRLAVSSATQTYNQAIIANENDDPSLQVDYSQEGGVTVFAPTENSWIEWDTGGSNPFFSSGFFERDPVLIRDLLQYHMVEGEVTASDLQDIASGAGAIETMSGDSLNVSTVGEGTIAIDDARVTAANLQSTNGLVHHLGARPSPSFYSVLGAPVDILEGVPVRNIMTVADRVDNSVFTINSSIGAAFTSAPLSDPSASFTAIIPTNGAFGAANFNTDNLFNAFTDSNPYISPTASSIAGQKLIDGHIIPGSALTSSELLDAGSKDYTTQLGNQLRVQVSGDSLFLNESIPVTTTDLEVQNGVIHYVSGGLIQTQLSVAERVLFSSPLSTVANGFYQTNRAGTSLSPGVLNESGVTAFAPINSAFSALPEGVPNTLLRQETALYGEILDYHIVESAVSLTDLQEDGEGTTYTTRQGQDIEITSTGPPLEINGVPVQQADSASNGFSHSIGGVLLPDPSRAFNLVESTILNGYLQFRTALEVTGNRGAVESEDGITVITPSDDGFQDFLDNTGASDLQSLTPDEESTLDNRLLMHVATRELSAEDIQAQLAGPGDVFTVETLLSQQFGQPYQLAFSLSGGNIVVRPLGAPSSAAVPIAQPDVAANNGIAHGIESVLALP